MTQQLELNAWINSSGSANDSWRRPDLQLDRIFSLDYYVDNARIAHRGVFSNIFMSDRPQLLINENTRPEQTFDPFVIFAAVLSQVPDIGAIVTASTTYGDPYTMARQLQSLNLLTNGRIGWNIVTSWHPEIAANFSADGLPGRAARYAKAEEFVDVVHKLWDSWQFPWNGTAGDQSPFYGDVKPINHQGQYFNVAGPLNLPSPSWGRPKIVQAGGSRDGVALAARYADYVYAPSGSLEGSRAFRTELRDAALALGRPNNTLPKLMPAISPIIRSTEEEVAAFKRERLAAAPVTDKDIEQLAGVLGVDLTRTTAEKVLSVSDFQDVSQSVIPIGVVRARRTVALDNGLSLRGLAEVEKLPGLIATPDGIADYLISWWQAGAADGFTISPRYLPDDLVLFVDEVVPILQRRGVYPRTYGGRRKDAA
jgi:FMN-dependent oxidoreductase (nitrilotriacetate monooxygenase family)